MEDKSYQEEMIWDSEAANEKQLTQYVMFV
jgi:hypothetical protein